MNKQLLHPILLLLICGALLFMAAMLPQRTIETEVCNDADTRPMREVAGTQLIWESLSRQFISSVQY